MGAIWRRQGVPHLARHMRGMCQCHVVAIATVLLLTTRWSCAQVTLSPSAAQPDAATSPPLLQPSPTAAVHTYSTPPSERTVSSPSLAYSSSSLEASTSDLKTISSNTAQSSSRQQMSTSTTASAFGSSTIFPSKQSVSYHSSVSHQSFVSHQSLVSSHGSVSSQSSISSYSSASTVLNQTAVMPKADGLESSTSVVSTAGSKTSSSMEQTSAFIQPTLTIISMERSSLRTSMSESLLNPSPSMSVVSTPLSTSVNPPLSTEVLPSSVAVSLVESSNSSLFPIAPTSSNALLSSSEFRFANESSKEFMSSSRGYSIEPTASLSSTIPPSSSTIFSFNASNMIPSLPTFTSSVGSTSTVLQISLTAVPISAEVVPSSLPSRLSSSEVTLVPTPSQTPPVATTTAMTSSSSSVVLRPSSVAVVTSSVAMVMTSSVNPNGTGGGIQAPAGSGGLPLAVLVGIVIACCVFVTICVVLMILLCFKRGGAYGAGSKKPNPANGGLWDDGVTLSYINSHIELPKEQGEEMKSLEGETDDPTPAAFTNYGYTDEANTVSTRL